MDDLYNRFEQAVTPRTKLILVCHITNRTGQIFPVRRICQMAHARNIPVIVDGAHAFSHFPYKISDLDCDYYGVSLHKWTYAPIGTGFLYVRKSRIASTWSLMASATRRRTTTSASSRKSARIRRPITTPSAKRWSSTRTSGIDRKAARLRYLRDRWANRLAQNPKVQHPAQPGPGAILRHRLPGLHRRRRREAARSAVDQVQHLTAYVPHERIHRPAHHAEHLHHRCAIVDFFADMVEKELA